MFGFIETYLLSPEIHLTCARYNEQNTSKDDPNNNFLLAVIAAPTFNNANSSSTFL